MPLPIRLRSLTATLLIAAAPAHALARAQSLDLVCQVHEIRGGAHRDIKRRLDIDLETKIVRISDDVGRGWLFKNEYPVVSIDRRRILLEASNGKDSFVDRADGVYSFRNQRDGVTMRGTCERAAPDTGATAKF